MDATHQTTNTNTSKSKYVSFGEESQMEFMKNKKGFKGKKLKKSNISQSRDSQCQTVTTNEWINYENIPHLCNTIRIYKQQVQELQEQNAK